MIKETRYCLSHLTDFNGRDARQTFWFYVLALVILQFVIGVVAAIPLVIGMFDTIFEAIQSGADPEDMEPLILASTAQWIGTTVWISAGAYVITAALFVAAFVRRLHDSGHSGAWAAVPLLTQAAAIAFSFSQMEKVEQIIVSASNAVEMQQMQADLTAAPGNYIGWIGYLVVIGFGVLKSQEGANRYGEEPQGL